MKYLNISQKSKIGILKLFEETYETDKEIIKLLEINWNKQ